MGRPNVVEYEDTNGGEDRGCKYLSSSVCDTVLPYFATAGFSGHLSQDAVTSVLPFLGARHLGMINCTSKRFSTASNIWEMLCLRDFGILRTSDSCSWKQTYRLAWQEWVVWHEGQPDYVQFIGSREGCQGVWSKVAKNGNTVEVMITM
jgi:hypothetical protein